MAVNRFLGQGHINISRPHNLVYLRNGLGSKRHGSHSLGSSHFIDPVHPGLSGRHQCGGIHLSVPSRRRGHDNLFHSRHFGRHNIHQHRGGIHRLAPRHVHAYPGQRGHSLSQDFSGGVCIKPSVPALFFMEGTDINQRLSHYLQQSGIHLFVGFLHFFLCHKDGSAIQLYAVKAGGIVKQGLVPLRFHPRHNIRHSFFILSVAVRASLQQIFQNILSGFLRQFYDPHLIAPPSLRFLLPWPAPPGSGPAAAW